MFNTRTPYNSTKYKYDPSKQNADNNLFVSPYMLAAHGCSFSWCFSHIAFFIVTKGAFIASGAYAARARARTGATEQTFFRTLKKAVDMGYIVKKPFSNGYKYEFNTNNDDVLVNEVTSAYYQAFAKSSNSIESLIELNPRACDADKMKGSKAKLQRITVTIEAYLLNKSAASEVFSDKGATYIAQSLAYLAELFGCDYRTIKAALSVICKTRKSFFTAKKALGHSIKLIMTKYKDQLAQVNIFNDKVKRYRQNKDVKVKSFIDKLSNPNKRRNQKGATSIGDMFNHVPIPT